MPLFLQAFLLLRVDWVALLVGVLALPLDFEEVAAVFVFLAGVVAFAVSAGAFADFAAVRVLLRRVDFAGDGAGSTTGSGSGSGSTTGSGSTGSAIASARSGFATFPLRRREIRDRNVDKGISTPDFFTTECTSAIV